MPFGEGVPDPCHAFFIVSSDTIFQASDHSVTIGVMKNIFFIGNP